tara:strand:- start:305 stop:499 length:195 start_codon:yes stop_codon:yes gene_type:complete
MSQNKVEEALLEERKVQALEKISKSLAILVLWFEEIDKEEWGERIQYYLSEFLEKGESEKKDES